MDNRLTDEMTDWSERPSLPRKQKRKLFKKEVRLKMHKTKCKRTGKLQNRICRHVSVYLLGIRLFTYKTKI